MAVHPRRDGARGGILQGHAVFQVSSAGCRSPPTPRLRRVPSGDGISHAGGSPSPDGGGPQSCHPCSEGANEIPMIEPSCD
jgi:hypothetical protein